MRKNLFFIFINLLVALSVGGQSVTRLLATSPFDNTLVVFDTATYATITTKTMPFSLGTYQGINGLARKPSTGVFYAVVNNGSGTRYLATLNPVNGSLTSIGSLGDNFSQLTFNGNGTLLGVTGAGASNPCKVYRINVNNASKSLAGTGTVVTSYGQIICYNPVDNRVYHWSGGSPTFNSYDTSFTSAPVNLTITAGNEVVGAVYKTGGIFVTHDFNGNILKTRSTGSSTVSLNYTSHYFKGLAYITCSRSITPSLPVACSNTTVSAITLTMSGTAGATYQWYKNNVAISGATLNTITTPTTAFGYYKCMINDGCGQDSLAPGVTFTTAPPPVVSITGGTFACPPTATVQLVGSSGGTSQ